ncbi:PolC-type DNA polymerase III [Olleya sp. HaHaR_3_96]|uniref:3'-5' exonuclease n=1 Tax=Olleya sp. HaHaR_3_96 TaxID=2745560 RepID=UPI001C4EFFD0|nr:3'-5' exonuclease [Olleya sp. HaHaR_3_96]QXP59177.1 3'-5' exonuclease [Olleya sp. HaHaR_3_96]
MGWFKRKIHPEFYNAYAETFKYNSTPLQTTRFVVFDTETTGLNTKTDKILSIGCVAITDGIIDVADSFECYLIQSQFNVDTVKIHGILKSGTIIKIEQREAIIQFLDYIKNAVIVAHHAAFDVAMINQALKQMDLPKLKNKVIDTGQLYKKTKYVKNQKHYSLDTLCNTFNIVMHDRHTASGDAYLTAVLFLKLSALLKAKKNRALKLRDFLNY